MLQFELLHNSINLFVKEPDQWTHTLIQSLPFVNLINLLVSIVYSTNCLSMEKGGPVSHRCIMTNMFLRSKDTIAELCILYRSRASEPGGVPTFRTPNPQPPHFKFALKVYAKNGSRGHKTIYISAINHSEIKSVIMISMINIHIIWINTDFCMSEQCVTPLQMAQITSIFNGSARRFDINITIEILFCVLKKNMQNLCLRYYKYVKYKSVTSKCW